MYAVIAALVGLAVGGLTLYTQWPRKTVERVTLIARVEPNLTFAEFVRANCTEAERAAGRCGGFSRATGRMRVVSVSVDVVEIVGYRGRTVSTEWLVVRRGGAPTALHGSGSSFTPSLNNDSQQLEPFWVPLPHRVGRFLVQIRLLDPKTMRTIQSVCTPEFAVVRRPRSLRGRGGQGPPVACS